MQGFLMVVSDVHFPADLGRSSWQRFSMELFDVLGAKVESIQNCQFLSGFFFLDRCANLDITLARETGSPKK